MHPSLSSCHLLTSCDGFQVSITEFFRRRCKQSNCCHVFKESWGLRYSSCGWMKCWVQFTVLLGRGDGESERRGEGIREILVLFLLHLTFTCILIFFYMYEGFACMYMCAPCTCLIPMDTKEGIISPCTRDCEQAWGFGELNPDLFKSSECY